MANRTYLAVSDFATIYPSYAVPDFDPATDVVAQAPYRVPLLWMGMFREQNVQQQSIDGELGSIRMVAPMVELTTGLRQLRDAIEILDDLFESGTLNEYYDLLSASMLTTDRQFVTLELEEVAYMFQPRAFFGQLNLALRALEGGDALEEGKQALFELSQLPSDQSKRSVPPARCLMDGDYTNEELANHAGLIGCQWIRHVHWEADLEIPVEARVNRVWR